MLKTVTLLANGGTLAENEMEVVNGYAIGELPTPTWNGAVSRFTVSTEGEHTFKWLYLKDVSTSDGDDCAWLDEVVWTPVASYAAWATDNGVTGEWDAVDADGIANVFRYIFNKPTGAFTTPPLLDITFNAAGKAVVKTPPVVNTDGFTIRIVASDNVNGTGNTTPYALDPFGETVINETGKTARFFRLRVEQAQ